MRTRYAAGQASVVNPRVAGSHGDMAQALAMAVHEHDRPGVEPSRATFGRPAGRTPRAGSLTSARTGGAFAQIGDVFGVPVVDASVAVSGDDGRRDPAAGA